VEFYQVNNILLSNIYIYIFSFSIGSHFGPWIRSWKASTTEANLGQCFIAIDPNVFEDDFEERLQKLINYCRELPPSG